jgi:hypothetical protein
MNDVTDQRGIARDVSQLPELPAAPPVKSEPPKVVQLPAAERATHQLLAQSQAEYGHLCMEVDRLAERKRAVLEHIAALNAVLQRTKDAEK